MHIRASPQTSTPSTPVTPGRSCVDLERFRADLREAGIEEMTGALLATFMQDSPGRLAALELAIHEGDAGAIRSAAHAFKSGAGTIRATLLTERLQQAEVAGRSGQLGSISELLGQIRHEYLAVRRELDAAQADDS